MKQNTISKILLAVWLLGFLFMASPARIAMADSKIYPLEIAVLHQPLVQGEESDFFIIINDKEMRQKIDYFVFYIYGNDQEPQTIEYHGESYIKFKRKMPSLNFNEYIQLKLDAYSDEEEKYLFRTIKHVKYDLKYPFGLLPADLGPQARESMSKEGDFSFSDIRAVSKEGESKGMGYSNPNTSTGFATDFVRNYSQTEFEELMKKEKESLERVITSAYQKKTIPQIDFIEISPSEKLIERMVLLNGSNATDNDPSRVFYDCYSYIYVVVQNDKLDQKSKVYRFEFKKSGENIAGGAYQGQIDSFQSMVKAFADSVVMQTFVDNNPEDKKQVISVSSNMNLHPVLTDYDLGNLNTSSLYEEIMAGKEPGVEELKKEKKKMEDREFKISFRYENNKTIWNTGVVNTGTDKDTSFAISVNIDAKAYDKDKKEITDISDEELYKDVYLLYEIINPRSQIAFQDKPENNKLKIKVNSNLEGRYLQSKGPILYKGVFLPIEYVVASLVNKKGDALTDRYLYTVHMKDASPSIELKEVVKEVDDVADSVFEFRINDEYHDKAECTVKIPYEKYQKNKIPFIKVSRDGQGEVSTYISPFECETNKWIKIRVKPPKLSNFDMLSELNGLNMWDLQRGTMETFATDLVGYGVDLRMAGLKKKKQALEGLYQKGYVKARGVYGKIDQYEKTMRFLDKANGLSGDVQNAIKLTQTDKNVSSHADDVKEGVKGWKQKDAWETSYDWGIAGINVLQSTVGVIAMAPKRIPVIGKYASKVTGTFSLVFNLMTNVWKGNLQYLSKEKKIDRAQEKNIPYPAMIGVSTREGFKDVSAEVISVLYTYLDNN